MRRMTALQYPAPRKHLQNMLQYHIIMSNPVANTAFLHEADTSSTLTLPDGRKLGYAQYGSPTGHPIILHHGLACSRLDGASFHEVGQELNARIIGIDRPGMGLSSPHSKRTLLDFVKDVEFLTEYLGLGSYCVMVRSILNAWFNEFVEN
jgi:hypothetical protein